MLSYWPPSGALTSEKNESFYNKCSYEQHFFIEQAKLKKKKNKIQSATCCANYTCDNLCLQDLFCL